MEIWKNIVGYEDRYKISNLGNVISKECVFYNKNTPYIRKEKPLQPYNNKGGYKVVNLIKNNKIQKMLVHRLVAIHFVEKKELNFDVVNHIDNNRVNNTSSNLEWCTTSLNQKHRYKTNYKHSANKKSKYLGVSQNRDKWRARINVNGKQYHIGTFKTEEEAKKAYDDFSL